MPSTRLFPKRGSLPVPEASAAAPHPGEILLMEFLKPLGVTQKAFAEHIGVGAMAVSDLCRGKRAVTPQLAFRLGRGLGMESEFWLNAQVHYDLGREMARLQRIGEWERIVVIPAWRPAKALRRTFAST